MKKSPLYFSSKTNVKYFTSNLKLVQELNHVLGGLKVGNLFSSCYWQGLWGKPYIFETFFKYHRALMFTLCIIHDWAECIVSICILAGDTTTAWCNKTTRLMLGSIFGSCALFSANTCLKIAFYIIKQVI